MVEDASTVKGCKVLSDEDLVAALQISPKDRVMQGEIYDRYAKRVYFKCLSIVKNQQIAKDYAHDIFIKIFTNIVQFKGRSKFSLWVHSITYNYCIKQISKKQLDTVDIEEQQEEIEDTNMVFVPQDQEQQLQNLQKSLEQLSQEDRILLSMKYWDDLRIEDIGKILNIENSAVKMRLKRARDRMRNQINSLSNLQE